MAKTMTQEKDERTETEKIFDTEFDQGIEVKSIFLHTTLSGPGVPTERTITDAKLPGIQIRKTKLGFLMKYKGKRVGVEAPNVATWFV